MDDLTGKRVERDLNRLDTAAQAAAMAAAPALGDMPALEAELKKYIPDWASDLMAGPGALVSHAALQFKKMGAPDGYVVDMLRHVTTVLDGKAVEKPLWPRPFAERPAWLRTEKCPGCGVDHIGEPGGEYDRATQAVRMLMWAYDELFEIIGVAPEGATDDQIAADRERTFEFIGLLSSMFQRMMQAMG